VNIGSETLALRKLKTKEVSKLHAKGLISVHAYEVRPRKDHRGVGLISDALPFEITDNVSGRYRSVNKFDTAKPTHAGVS
jgi:hypothetical protein